ncbi:MAG: TlpA disulfide reductase family protein [Rhodospirillales bacterium]|nr:TlpA disulfide reductase family protein [Rhodospirillales bacterium]
MFLSSAPPPVTRRVALGTLLAAARAHRAEAASLAPLSRILVELRPPLPLPGFSFQTATGAKRMLADYRGQGVVLNIWATWCGPCVAEMPELDRLAVTVKKFSIAVLPLSIDAKGLSAVQHFYAAHRIEKLEWAAERGVAEPHAHPARTLPFSPLASR